MNKETSTEPIKENKQINRWVKQYVELMKLEWGDLLAKHGYNEIEEDLSDDGEWHGDVKLLGKVGFWKQKGLDGVITQHGKGYDSYSGYTHHGTAVYMVGDSRKYFADQGFLKVKESLFKKLKVDKLYNTLELKKIITGKIEKIIGHNVNIKLNEKDFEALELSGGMDFYGFLMGDKKD